MLEVAFIVFFFYSNLLMGEFTVSNAHGRNLRLAIIDIFTVTNSTIAIVTALIGFVAFEYLRKKL